jgi:hypothetical protein
MGLGRLAGARRYLKVSVSAFRSAKRLSVGLPLGGSPSRPGPGGERRPYIGPAFSAQKNPPAKRRVEFLTGKEGLVKRLWEAPRRARRRVGDCV